jgi:hypothetical protein
MSRILRAQNARHPGTPLNEAFGDKAGHHRAGLLC